jgi:isopenicillin-N N-acyltransferase-like protein
MIPLIETGGSARDIGHDVGIGVAEQLQAAVAATREGYSPEQWSRIEAALPPILDAIDHHAPECGEELRGMASSAGVRYEDLVIGNASEELEMFAGIAVDPDRIGAAPGLERERNGCTVAGITPAGTSDGHVLLGHNEDATAGWADLAYVIKAEPAGAPAFVAFTYAGYLLHQGVNSAGLGSVGNALYARDARPGIPKLLLYRRALAQSTIEEAIRAATDTNRAFGNNHLFATGDGDIYDVEVSGATWDLLHAGNRSLVHANHFLSPRMRHLDEDEDLLNSRLRQLRVERLIDAAWGSLDVPTIKGIFADHANYPKSVCKHHAPESDLDYGTIGSVVIDVTTRTLTACAGNPCRGEWRTVAL